MCDLMPAPRGPGPGHVFSHHRLHRPPFSLKVRMHSYALNKAIAEGKNVNIVTNVFGLNLGLVKSR